MTTQNPYESPPTVAREREEPETPQRRDRWRTWIGILILLVSAAPALTAIFGLLNLQSRGWPTGVVKTVILLVATSMFFVASIGTCVIGLGVMEARRKLIAGGFLTVGVAFVVYTALYVVSHA